MKKHKPPRYLQRVLDLDQFAREMRPRLPRAVFDYVAAGAESEAAMRANRAVFDRWRLVTRVLVGVRQRHQEVDLFGKTYTSPFGIAPMGGSALVAYQGHVEMARAARAANIPFILSANSVIPLEEVAKANPDFWFAAYQTPDEASIRGMIERLRKARVKVLVVTADVPVDSNREADKRDGFSLPIRPNLKIALDVLSHPRWLAGTLAPTLLKRKQPHLVNLEPWGGPGLLSRKAAGIAAEALNWTHIRLMRKLWEGKLVVKGILSSADVTLAKEAGADGVILSNHGGRQLDYAAVPMEMLEEAAAEAGPEMTVMLDGGFRRGTDVVKALALGARAAFIGRPFLFAAAFGGQAGVARAIELMRTEFDKDMALLGVHSPAEITSACLKR